MEHYVEFTNVAEVAVKGLYQAVYEFQDGELVLSAQGKRQLAWLL